MNFLSKDGFSFFFCCLNIFTCLGFFVVDGGFFCGMVMV